MAELKRKIQNPLTVADLANPLFDKRRPAVRRMPARQEVIHLLVDDVEAYENAADEAYDKYALAPEGSDEQDGALEGLADLPEVKEPVIEGVTVTDSFREIIYAYHQVDGMLYVDWLDKKNQKSLRLIERPITTAEEFERYVKLADKRISSYLSPGASCGSVPQHGVRAQSHGCSAEQNGAVT